VTTAASATASAAPGSGRLLLAAGLSGAAVMIVELTATRLFAPWFGASIFAWTNVVATVLLALAGGYAVGGRLADARPSARLVATTLLIAAAFTALAAIGGPYVAGALAPSSVGDPASHTGALVGGSLLAAAAVFGPPLFLLGWTSPFVVRLLTDAGVPAGVASGRTSAVATLGSLVGAYLPAFVLLERIGSRGSVLTAAAVLVLAALCLFGRRAPRGPTAAAAMIVVASSAAAAFTPFVPASKGESPVRDQESAYQFIRVADRAAADGRVFRNLSLDEGREEFHSRRALDGGPLTDAYYDVLAVLPDWIADADRRPVAALVLGGGAGTLRGLLRRFHEPRLARVVDVEIDPLVAALAPDFGGAPKPPDALYTVDGRTALRALPGPFDLIVLDAYARQIAIPAHLGTREAFAEARAKLSDRGLFAINVSVADLDSPLAKALIRTLDDVFGAVSAVPVAGSWNVILVGGPLLDPRRVPPSRGDALDAVRREFRRNLLASRKAPDGLLLVDDCAPLETLARKIK
jgi:spermidine synthase